MIQLPEFKKIQTNLADMQKLRVSKMYFSVLAGNNS